MNRQWRARARVRRFGGWKLLAAALLTNLAACSPPGLLITPVTTRRELVETILQRESASATDKIAILDVSGLLMNAHTPRLLGEGEHPVSLLLEQLDAARGDSRVKAVILKINSPGGTVTASELMYDEIRHFKKQTGKPVVAVLMDVAASGGYYVACACDEIVAQPTTVTGSIGVLMQTFELSGTLNLIGVKSDAITSGVRKDSGSPFRPMRPEERELFQRIIDEMYERFVQVVVAGRPKLDEASIRRLADGRVYTAEQAREAGLVDRIAPLRDVVQSIKQRIGGRAIRLVTYQRPLDYRPNYYAGLPARPEGDINLLKLDWPGGFVPATPQFMYLWCPGM